MTTTSRSPLACRTCNSTDVWFCQTRAGKWYLAVVLPATADFPHSTPIRRPHVCPSDEQIARRAEADAKISAQIADQVHFATIRESHAAGEHTEFNDECTTCYSEALDAKIEAEVARRLAAQEATR